MPARLDAWAVGSRRHDVSVSEDELPPSHPTDTVPAAPTVDLHPDAAGALSGTGVTVANGICGLALGQSAVLCDGSRVPGQATVDRTRR